MGLAALITWFVAILAGPYMLAVWLIENDVTSRATPSRLPAPVIFGHLFLAATGFTLWVGYLVIHRKTLAWAAVAVLLGIATLGRPCSCAGSRCTTGHRTHPRRPLPCPPSEMPRPRGTSR
jgi:hypothetical protein